MSLIALLAFKANGIFEVYFHVKKLSKFLTLLFFQKLTYVATSVLGYCGFSNLMTPVKLFAAVLHIKEAKIIVVEDSGQNAPVIILLVKVKTLRTYSVEATL